MKNGVKSRKRREKLRKISKTNFSGVWKDEMHANLELLEYIRRQIRSSDVISFRQQRKKVYTHKKPKKQKKRKDANENLIIDKKRSHDY